MAEEAGNDKGLVGEVNNATGVIRVIVAGVASDVLG